MQETSTAPVLELDRLHNNLKSAVCAEDVFGVFPNLSVTALKRQAKKIYLRLSKVCHPDINQNNEKAAETFHMLNGWWQEAEQLIRDSTYGQRRRSQRQDQEAVVIKTRKAEYKIVSAIGRGDISNIYRAEFIGEDNTLKAVIVKIVIDKADNDLVQNEIRISRMLRSEPDLLLQHLPVFLDQFRTTDGKIGSVFEFLDESYDLNYIHARNPNGVDPKHVVWMFKRLLGVLGFVHGKKIVHCNIEPSHILVRPRDHNAFLIDWSYAAYNPKQTQERFRVGNELYSPPEVFGRKSPLPSSDLYSLAKCMVYILGGDVKTNAFPATVPRKLQNFLRSFLLQSPLQRPRYAWDILMELKQLNRELWGPSQFREFIV